MYKIYAPGSVLNVAASNFFFLLKFAIDFFLIIEKWLKRLTLSWKFVDQKFHILLNFMKRLNHV